MTDLCWLKNWLRLLLHIGGVRVVYLREWGTSRNRHVTSLTYKFFSGVRPFCMWGSVYFVDMSTRIRIRGFFHFRTGKRIRLIFGQFCVRPDSRGRRRASVAWCAVVHAQQGIFRAWGDVSSYGERCQPAGPTRLATGDNSKIFWRYFSWLLVSRLEKRCSRLR